MHKLCFFEERYGDPLCVGCGRCLIDCPATMDITAIIDRVSAMPHPGAANAPMGEEERGEAAAELIEVVAAERKE